MIISGTYRHGALVFPGSFNPLHDGHRSMASIARQRYGLEVQPELSIVNVDKAEIASHALNTRLVPMRSLGEPLVTRAAKFVEKAACFPGCRFIVGADTALRLDDIAYAGGQASQRDHVIESIGERGCRFLVFGRIVKETFLDAEELPLSKSLRELCDFVPQSEFRNDISSTALRGGPSS